MPGFLEEQTQQKICSLLLKNPGLHLSKIAELLDMPISVVEGHLKYLEQKETIISTTEAGYKKYYCKDGSGGYVDKKILETRQNVFNLISKNPGLHLSKIARMLSMRKSLAEYHLNYLEKTNVLISIKKGGYKRYYVKGSEIDSHDRRVLAIVRQDIPFKILSLLLKNSILKHKEIFEAIDIPASTLSYHLNKLVSQDILKIHRYGDVKGYSLNNKKSIMKFLVRYEMHTAVESFKDVWDDIQ